MNDEGSTPSRAFPHRSEHPYPKIWGIGKSFLIEFYTTILNYNIVLHGFINTIFSSKKSVHEVKNQIISDFLL